MNTVKRLAKLSVRAGQSFVRDPLGFLKRLPGNAVRLARNPVLVDLMIADEAITYPQWIAQNELSAHEAEKYYADRLSALPSKPLFSVLMPVYNSDHELLLQAIQSVRDQYYDNWELCIIDDASTDPALFEMLGGLSREDNRIRVSRRAENGHICRATNDAFAMSSGQWIALLDHDDLLAPNALAEVVLAIESAPDARLIYSDEDKVDAVGNERFAPHFKPDYSPELLRSQNYINHLSVFERSLIEEAGGWRVGFEGSQDHDLLLRAIEKCGSRSVVHIPRILYHWRAAEGSTAAEIDNKGYAVDAGIRAIRDHVERIGMDAVVEQAPGLPFYRVRPKLEGEQPSVSIIIPTRDRVELLKNCLTGVLEETDYTNMEVIVVDNNSEQSETLNYLSKISADDRVRVLRDAADFNFSALNNKAVRTANGEIIVMLNNDIEVIEGNWLTEMVSWAVLPEVGCVGAKLLYGDGLVQHAGVVLGIGGVAGHSHKRYNGSDHGYFGRLQLVQNYSAVTAASLAVRKSTYEKVGGLDEKNLAIAFNDVDFCLKVQQAGYRNVWTPYAELYHLESHSRGAEDTPEKQARFLREVKFMQNKWGAVLQRDPYYSPNLTLSREDFSLRRRP